MEPEFIIDEEALGIARDLRQLIPEAIRRESRLKDNLRDLSFEHEQELAQIKKFLQGLIEAMENRCDDLIRMEQRRLADPGSASHSPEETQKWLRRVERIQEAFTNILMSYGVTRFEPTGPAVPDRDWIRDRDDSTPGPEPGTILRVIASGYYWRGEVLRPAQVVVSA